MTAQQVGAARDGGSSVVEDRKGQLAQTRRIGDWGDLAMHDQKIEDAEQPLPPKSKWRASVCFLFK